MDTGEWYIEVNGKKVGPFSLDHIQGLLDDGEIRPYHQVTSVMTGGQWISVQEALNGIRSAPQAPPEDIPTVGVAGHPVSVGSGQAVTEFNPPPRPEIAPSENPPISEENDPATILFDALQLERERRTTTIGPYRARSGGKTLFRMRKVAAKIASVKEVKLPVPLTARMFWTAIFAGLVLGSLTYGVMRAFKHHAPPGSGTLTPLSGTAPVAAITPTVPTTSTTQPTVTAPANPFHRDVTRPFGQPMRRMVPQPPPAHVPNPPRYNGSSNYGDNYREHEEGLQQRDNGYPPRDNSDNGNGENDNGYPPSDNDSGSGNGNSNSNYGNSNNRNNRMRRFENSEQQQQYQDNSGNSGDQQPNDTNAGQSDDQGQQGLGGQQPQQQQQQPSGQYDQNSQDGGYQNPNQGNAQGQGQDQDQNQNQNQNQNYNQNYTQ